jgi:hypothetical protein
MTLFILIFTGVLLGLFNLGFMSGIFLALDEWDKKVSDPAKRRLDCAGNPILSRKPPLWVRIGGHKAFRVAFGLFYFLVLIPAFILLVFGPVLSPMIADPIVRRVSYIRPGSL